MKSSKLTGAILRAGSLVVGCLTVIALLSVVATVPQLGLRAAAAQDASNQSTDIVNEFANVVLPPEVGQTSIQAYVSKTGHSIRGAMLDYWRANGAAAVYGDPITEPFASRNGYYSQAFEAAVFQYRPEYQYTADPIVRLMPISGQVLSHRVGTLRRDGRRAFGGGDNRTHAWRWVDPNGNAAQKAVNNGGEYIADTGHTITGAMLDWYNNHEGSFYLGNPLTQQVNERGMTVQYFEGGLLMKGPDGAMSLAPVAKENAKVLGLDTTRADQGGLPEFDESLFFTAPNPNPMDDQSAPGRKHLEVSIGEQTLWAYQGDTLVAKSLVSTGIEPNHTEKGDFHVRFKEKSETMTGFTNATGEVVGLGDGSGEQKGIPYEVKDVPNVMYFDLDAEALHGAYWHNNFGNRMSHGCINLPLDFAAFLFGWAPLGTEVWVHQ
ncbi:MAG: L,D-transpeptidase [Thermomicrobiales bacterium]